MKQEQDKQRSIFYFGTTPDIRFLAGVEVSSQLEALIGEQLYESLIGYDGQTGKIIPALADSLPTVSSDGLVYTFHLRQGVQFHDGSPFNAQAVLDSYFRARDDPLSQAKNIAFKVINVNATKIPDAYTIEFHLFQPFGPALALFASGINMGGLISSPLHNNPKNDEYVGTGPWKFDHWTRDVEIVLTRNDNYWNKDKIPNLKTLVFKFYKDISTLVLDLKAHVLDAGWPSLPTQDLQSFMKDNRFNVQRQITGANIGLAINEKVQGLNDVRVRQAIAYAIDRNEIVSRVYGNISAVAAYSLVPEIFPGFVPTFQVYTFDPAKGKQLMIDAGYASGLDISLTYSTPRVGDAALATVLQSQLARIGVRLKIQAMDAPGYTATFRASRFDMLSTHWIYDYFDGAQYLINFLGNRAQGATWANYVSFNNTQAQGLISQLLVTREPTAQMQIYKQLQEICASNVAFLPMVSDIQYLITWKTVQGFQIAIPYFATSWAGVTKTI